ncbi:MAG: hypothetical protein ACO1TE_12235 [Prosthecobacter sp.]
MNRRHWLQLSTSAAVPCAGRTARSAPSGTAGLKAGPFSMDVPAEWARSAVIEKAPLFPLYDAAEWKGLQTDPSFRKKPGYICRPQHWAVRLPAALPEGFSVDLKNAGDDATAPQILIHKADEWAVAFTDGVHEKVKAAELLRRMRARMDDALTRDEPGFTPGYMDATLSFTCLKKRLEFTGGHGVRLAAQWTIEADLLRKGELHYLFVGMSQDNTCQIIATFPLNLPGLPGADDSSHLGRGMRPYEEMTKGFNSYENTAREWLEKNAATITPSLETLDAMMSSLVARTWE